MEGDTNKKIHSKYDLKGSSLGRSAKEGEKVLKDNDLDVKYGKIHLASQKAAFIEVRIPLDTGGGKPGERWWWRSLLAYISTAPLMRN